METRRLDGKTVLVTRPREQARELQDLLEALGAKTLVQPAIEILPPEDWTDVDDALRSLRNGKFDWTLFSSANGVRFTFERAKELTANGSIQEIFAPTRIAAVGTATTQTLEEYGAKAELVPETFDAEGVCEALEKTLGDRLAQTRFLSFRASRGRKTLSERLTAQGAFVRETIVYRSVDATSPDPDVLAALNANQIDLTTATSSASAKALIKMLGESAKNTKWIAISPLTANALRESGVEPAGVAEEATMQSLAQAAARANDKRR